MTAEAEEPAGAASGQTAASAGSNIEEVLASLAKATGPWPEDLATTLAGCKALEAATLRSVPCQRRAFKADGAKVLVSSMQAHLKDCEVQVLACRVLQHLASLASLDGPAVLAEAGACAAVRAAMDAHAEDAEVQQAACHAVELMAFGGERPRAQAVAAGCPEGALKALKAFRQSLVVQQASLAALQAQVEDAGCREVLAKAGPVGSIINSVAEHKNDQEVLSWGKCLLKELCNQSDELRSDIIRKCHYQKIDLDF